MQPEIRRGFKQFIRQFGFIQTNPTKLGKTKFTIFHPAYGAKHFKMALKDIQRKNNILKYQDILEAERE